MAFDAGFVAGEFQAELFVAVGRGDDASGDLPGVGTFVARIAFQFAGEISVRDFDQSLVRLVREAFVVNWRLRRSLASGRRFRLLLLSRHERTPQNDDQATKHEGRFDFVGQHKIGRKVRSSHQSLVRTLLRHAQLAFVLGTDE